VGLLHLADGVHRLLQLPVLGAWAAEAEVAFPAAVQCGALGGPHATVIAPISSVFGSKDNQFTTARAL
jgi:hypothetical protein